VWGVGGGGGGGGGGRFYSGGRKKKEEGEGGKRFFLLRDERSPQSKAVLLALAKGSRECHSRSGSKEDTDIAFWKKKKEGEPAIPNDVSWSQGGISGYHAGGKEGHTGYQHPVQQAQRKKERIGKGGGRREKIITPAHKSLSYHECGESHGGGKVRSTAT